MLKEDITQIRKDRHKKTQEDFTPQEVLEVMFNGVDESLYINFKKTFCDPCIGTGNIYLWILEKRLENCKNANDVYKAISSMYGTELMADNVRECKRNILMTLLRFSADKDWDLKDKKIVNIIDKNIVCTDTFKWDYENWKPMYEQKQLSLFEE